MKLAQPIQQTGAVASEYATAAPKSAPPRLSIGMPVYNAETFLKQALDALLCQTFTNFELIISDNASDDRTEMICREYAARHVRIRYHREATNHGAAWNFNHVFHLARGEYFKWAAADDVCQPSYLEQCINVLDSDDDVVACHTRTRKIDATGLELPTLGDPTQVQRSDARGPSSADCDPVAERFLDVLLTSGWSVRSYSVIRRAALANTSLVQPCYGWEKVTMSELALQGRFRIVPEILFSQREHAGASTSLKGAAAQEEFFAPRQKRVGKTARWLLLWGYVSATFRQELSTLNRARCLWAVGRYLMQAHKWPQVVHDWRTRAGITGARDKSGTRRDSRMKKSVGSANSVSAQRSRDEVTS